MCLSFALRGDFIVEGFYAGGFCVFIIWEILSWKDYIFVIRGNVVCFSCIGGILCPGAFFPGGILCLGDLFLGVLWVEFTITI